MKSRLLKWFVVLVTLSLTFQSIAQEDSSLCNENFIKAQLLIHGSESVAKDPSKAVPLLKVCADQGNAKAQYLLGILYRMGLGTKKDGKQAFKYLELSANQNFPRAICALGGLYKNGIGCKLNFNTAIELFEKSHQLGFSKGSYSIGYMYFKGLGSLEQDYDKAIEWFEKSDFLMAKHWLGICNYFGYGMAVNKEKALQIWENNPISNSRIILEHIKKNKDLLSLGTEVEETIKATEFGPEKINEVVVAEPVLDEATNSIRLNLNDLVGQWQGKLVELDWSRTVMNRSFPVSLNFTKEENTGALNCKANLNEVVTSSQGTFLDQSFHFNTSLQMNLPRLYQDDRKKYVLDYDALSLDNIEVKEINNIRYLTAELVTKVTDWSEPGAPMLLILGNTKGLTDNGKEIDDDLIQSLANLKGNSFINLYPNPFVNDLLIQYDLPEDGLTSVDVFSFVGQHMEAVVSAEQQKQGKHLYHIDSSAFVSGLYIVKVTTSNVIYTKLIIKD